MGRNPSFEVIQTGKGWRVRVPGSLSDTGKEQVRFFKARRAAESFAQERRVAYRRNGESHSVLPPRVADDAMVAWGLLEPFGISLTQAAKDALARRLAIDASVTLAVAVDRWTEANERRLRETTLESYKATMKLVEKSHREEILANLSGEKLAKAIGGKSYSMHRRNLSAFWKWCASPPRRWCDAAALEDVAKISEKNDADVTVLSPELVELLLRTAEKFYPETVPIYVIGFFGGVRVEERKRLDALQFTEDGIEIGSAIAKKRRRRFIPLNDSLAAWLKKYPFGPCLNFAEKDKAVRRLAGWNVEARLLEDPTDPTLGNWPRNVIRHTHASAEIAGGALLEDLLFRFGHTASPETLRSHYVGRYTKREAVEFHAIRPLEDDPGTETAGK